MAAVSGMAVAAVPGTAGAAAAGTVTGVKAPLPANAATEPFVDLRSVSCASAGNCTAVGDYVDSSGSFQGLLLTRASGTWTATEAPLPAHAPASPGFVALVSVSCASAGNCTAVGEYSDRSGRTEGLLLTQTSGTWTAAKAPVPANAATDPGVFVRSVSCASAGNCTAVGEYGDRSGFTQGLLLTQTSGTWTAAKAPVPANAATEPEDILFSVSCASAGNCTAVSNYFSKVGDQGLLLTQASGAWTAAEAPLPADAASNPGVGLGSVSCPSAGNCTTVGGYYDSSSSCADCGQGLLLTQASGTWTAAKALLPANSGVHPAVGLNSVSCASAGNCTTVGGYLDNSVDAHGLLLTQTSGRWATGVQAPLPANADPNPLVSLVSVSCASAGNCTAVGGYGARKAGSPGLLLTQTSGHWATGVQAPLPAGAQEDASLSSVSCPSAGNCTAVGNYIDKASTHQGLLVTQSAPAPADLALHNSGAPNPVKKEHVLTYTITAHSTGGRAAASVKITDRLPANTRFGSVSTTQGTCKRVTNARDGTRGGTVICRIGTLAPAAAATVKIVVRPTEEGTLHDTATVTAPSVTSDANDSATATVTVQHA
jgi:uncharacterized repeat protein (TIGR01451 family)